MFGMKLKRTVKWEEKKDMSKDEDVKDTRETIMDLVWWIDKFSELRNEKEINFIANMVDNPPPKFSRTQIRWIKDIYDRGNI